MDYKQELDRLKANPTENEFWSPEPGQYKVTALTEIEDSEPFEDDKDQKPRKKLRISVNGKENVWTFPFGKKESSIYGQLVQFGAHKGKIKDEQFTIIVVGKDQDRRYTVVI